MKKYRILILSTIVAIATTFSQTKGWSQDLIPFQNSNGKNGYKDKQGKIIIDPKKYDEIGLFSEEGLAVVRLKDKYGFVNKVGKEIVPLKYDAANGFHSGVASVGIANTKSTGWIGTRKWGFIDKTGKEVISLKYDYVHYFSQELAAVELNAEGKTGLWVGKWGFIDKSGKEVIAAKYDFVADFSEGYAAAGNNGNYAFTDKNVTGYVVNGMEYVGGKYGFITKTGKEIVPLIYDQALRFSEGLARVKLNNRRGFIDSTGNQIIPLLYDRAGDFSEGLAPVSINKNWGFIDKSGKIIIPMKYKWVGQFSNGRAPVGINDKWGFIDKSGKGEIANREVFFFSISEESGLETELFIPRRWGWN